MGWFGNRQWRSDDGYWRNRRGEPWRKPRSFKWVLRDFLFRVAAFTALCAMALGWLKYHFLDGRISFPF